MMNIDLDDDFGYDVDLALMMMSTMLRISRILRWESQKYEVMLDTIVNIVDMELSWGLWIVYYFNLNVYESFGNAKC